MTTDELLLNCISAFLKGEKLTPPEDTDWQELIQKAAAQKIVPFLYEALGASMPENVKNAVKSSAVSTVALQTKRTAEFLKTYKELNEAGIYPLVVKGIVCRSAYDKPEFRASGDEDVYVPLEDYPAFHEKMLELGYASKKPDYKNAHEERYTRNGLLIEGHWELFPQENDALNALNVLADGFWDRAETQSVNGVGIKTLEPTDHMIFLLLHTYKHFINSGVGVRQLCDVALWSNRYELDWERIREAMRMINGECFAGAVFDAGGKYFGMTCPESWERADSAALIEDALNGGIYGTASANRLHSGSITLGAVENAHKNKKSIPLVKALFPNRAVMEMSYPWVKKSGALLPAAWAVRILRYVGEIGQHNSASESIKIGAKRMELLKQYKII